MTDAPEITPLAVAPDRPDPDDIVASTWGQWVHDDTARTERTRSLTIAPATFDSNGLFTLTAAMVGLATIAGVTWNLYNAINNPTGQPTQLVAGMNFRAGPGTMILVAYAFQHPNGTMSRIGAGAITELHVTAWGDPI